MLREGASLAIMTVRRCMAFAALGLGLFPLGTQAWAGSGPWTLEANEHNVYIGADYYRYANFSGASGASALQTGVTAAGATGVWTVGMAPGLEAEVKLAFESVRVNQMDSPACIGPGKPDDWCDPTANIGDLGARVKWRFVDEAYGPPVSLAISLAARSGETYANQRARLTTLATATPM